MDVRSRKVLSMVRNSDGIIITFKKTVRAYGIPKEFYLDNGKGFLVRDFCSRGKRKSSGNASYGTTMLECLNVRMTNVLVSNGRDKVIERSFKQFSEEFSKLSLTYFCSRSDKRPERHRDIMKEENIPLRSEVEAAIWTYIEVEGIARK